MTSQSETHKTGGRLWISGGVVMAWRFVRRGQDGGIEWETEVVPQTSTSHRPIPNTRSLSDSGFSKRDYAPLVEKISIKSYCTWFLRLGEWVPLTESAVSELLALTKCHRCYRSCQNVGNCLTWDDDMRLASYYDLTAVGNHVTFLTQTRGMSVSRLLCVV